MKKDEILLKLDRVVRKGNGSLTIALPKETYKLLNLSNKEDEGNKEIKIIIYKSGKIEIEKGEK